jgi:hypothetical protein
MPGRDNDHEAAMTENPRYRGRRQTRDRLPVGRTRAARGGAIATLIALILLVTTASAMGAPLQQSTTDAANLEPPTTSGATLDASRMAAIVAVVNRQGLQGPMNLTRVSAVVVSNQVAKPALVVDARAKRAAEAEAAAAAIALTVQATVEAQEAEAASKAAALATIQESEAAAAASATAAAIATETARDSAQAAAVLSAKQEAEVRAAEVAAARTRNAQAAVAPAVGSDPILPGRTSLLLIALTLMLGGALGLRLWRSRQEPFVLKANPIPARSSAPA